MAGRLIEAWRRLTIKNHQMAPAGNNFNAVRLVLASGVIWTHCYALVHGIRSYDDLSSLIGVPVSYLAVNGFFYVSGFLVCQSIFRQSSALSFAAMRVGRIWPGLAASLLVTVLTFAALSENPVSFVFSLESLRYLAKNLTQVFAHYSLPTLTSGHDRVTVNESLWTIPWEIRCYVVLALAYVIPNELRMRVLKVALCCSLVFCGTWIVCRDYIPRFPTSDHGLLFYINGWSRLWGCFGAGALTSLLWRRVPICPLALLPLWLAVLVENQAADTTYLSSPAMFYSVLVAAFAQKQSRPLAGRWHDLSFGIYIYAYPVMVLIFHFWPTDSFRSLALATFLLTIPLATASWLFVEKPALARVKTMFRPKGIVKATWQRLPTSDNCL